MIILDRLFLIVTLLLYYCQDTCKDRSANCKNISPEYSRRGSQRLKFYSNKKFNALMLSLFQTLVPKQNG